MKATEQSFPVVLFITLHNVGLPFEWAEFVDEILKCGHSNESYWAVLSCGAVYYTVQSGSVCWVLYSPLVETAFSAFISNKHRCFPVQLLINSVQADYVCLNGRNPKV